MIKEFRQYQLESVESAFKRGSWIKYIFYIFNEFLTPLGKSIIIINMISAPLSFVAFNTTAYAFFTTLTSIVTVSFFYGIFFRPKLKISRVMPNLVENDTVIKYYITLKNEKKRSYYQVKVKELIWSIYIKYYDDFTIEEIKKDQEINYEITFKIKKRGIYDSKGLIIYSSFPFSIFNHGVFYKSPSKIFVFPKYERIESLDIKLGRKFQPGGISFSSNVGESTEFTGTREFVYGDNPKYIHWRSWAKTGIPIVREFTEEYFVRLGIVFDIYSKNIDDFEKALSYVATVTDYLSRYDYIVDVFAVGNSFYHFQSGRAISYFENILELLASIEPDKQKKGKKLIKENITPFEDIYNNLAPYIENLSSLVIILTDWDDQRENFVRKILENGVGIKVNIFAKKLTKEIPIELKDFVTTIF
ncbi:MAG: DUF58 domain-containing protein [Cyanobacteriota bacterium]